MFHHKCLICRFFDDEPLHQFVKPHNAETHDSARPNTIQMCHVFCITKATHRSVCPLIILGGSINLKMPRLRGWTFADKTNRNICYSSVWNIHCLIATKLISVTIFYARRRNRSPIHSVPSQIFLWIGRELPSSLLYTYRHIRPFFFFSIHIKISVFHFRYSLQLLPTCTSTSNRG